MRPPHDDEPLPHRDLPAQRASDEDRDRVVAVLRDRYVAGQITFEEFAQRTETALAATSRSDLVPLVSDLDLDTPPAPELEPAAPAPAPTQWTLAILSSQKRRGRWRVGPSTNALAFWGSCKLDLREAQLDTASTVRPLEIQAVAIMGSIKIVVPEGVEVELEGFALMGSNEARTSHDAVPGLPRIVVRAFSLMGSVKVQTSSSRRRGSGRPAMTTGDQHDDERRALPGTSRAERQSMRDNSRARREASRHARREPRETRSIIGEEIRDHVRRIAEEARAGTLDPNEVGRQVRRTIDAALRGSMEAIAASVQGERPDLGPEVAPDGTVTILFSDIEGFSQMTEELGDLRAQEVLRTHNELLRGCVRAHQGHEVKSAGDSFMVAFASARRALRCARDVQRAFTEYNATNPDYPVRVRMGLHTGEVIHEATPAGHDFFGRNVILAARIAGEASGGQILVSSVLRELTHGTGEFVFSERREVELKGLSGTHAVYAVDWETDTAGPVT